MQESLIKFNKVFKKGQREDLVSLRGDPIQVLTAHLHRPLRADSNKTTSDMLSQALRRLSHHSRVVVGMGCAASAAALSTAVPPSQVLNACINTLFTVISVAA